MFFTDSIIRFQLILFLLKAVLCSTIVVPVRRDRAAICRSPKCFTRGQVYSRNINYNVKPCDDFFEYACGNWQKPNPRPKYTSEWTVPNILSRQMLNMYRKLLDTASSEQNSDTMMLAKEVLSTCFAIPKYPRAGPKTLGPILRKIGSYPAQSIWEIHNNYLRLTGESAFFGYQLLANKQNQLPILIASITGLLNFSEPVSAYGAIFHTTTWKPQEEKSYLDFLFLAKKSLKNPGSDASIRQKVIAVLEFRKTLEEIIQRRSKMPPGPFRPLTPEQLQKHLTLPMGKITEKIPWISMTHILLGKLSKTTIDTSNIVTIRQSGYFHELFKLLNQTPETILVLHMNIFFIERHLVFDDIMNRLLESTSIEPHPLDEYIRTDNLQRWEHCIDLYNDQQTLARSYFNQLIPKPYVKFIQDLIHRMKVAMKKQMEHSTWLVPTIRANLENKLNEIREWIGTREISRNFTAQQLAMSDRFDIRVPNVVFNTTTNELYIDAGLLTSPIYEPELPLLYNLAAMGTMIGHELYHIISDCTLFDKKGDSPQKKQWLTTMKNHCTTRKLAFIAQYNKITAKEFSEKLGIKLSHVDTSKSSGEDYPDAMGLEAAFNAYRMERFKNPASCQTLPQFQEFSCDQMFFLAFANDYCGYVSPKKARLLLGKSRHSINNVRVNGAVSNNEDFAKAFKCAPGTPMNPAKKNSFWM